ncbi:MAG TPA: calcium-binding protein, partial [Pirellulaceae bacterium]|nr:calcium-binding protein [Pirellulaceae bacterium]
AGGDLARFGNICIPNPFYTPPDELFEPGTTKDSQMKGDVVPIGEHELWLNIGDRAKWREVGGVDTHDDVLVEHIGTMNGLDTLRVTYGGRSKIYAGINRIIADSGAGDDRVVIGEGVTADVQIQGGDGADTLISHSSGRTEMWGDSPVWNFMVLDYGDYLEGGLGENYLHGGWGRDLIVAGTGPSTLVGGVGADSLLGGAANDVLYGDEVGGIDDPSGGNDVLYGGGGADEMYGGGGDDTMFGDSPNAKPASDKANVMHGGVGADSIFAGDHGDTIFGGGGDDYIETGAGDDVIATYSQADPFEFGAHNVVHWSVGDGAAIVRNSAYSINSLSLTGGKENDVFSVAEGASLVVQAFDSQIDVNSPGAKWVRATNLSDLNIDGEAGEDTINIGALKFNAVAPNPLARISVNMATEFRSDGEVDHVNVSGSPGADTLVVESLEAWLQDPNTCGVGGGSSRDGHPDYSDCKSGGVMRISGMKQYEIYLTNTDDDLVISTGSGDDQVTVRGATGPTRIDTGAGNDDIVVSARTLGGPPPAWNAPPKAADFLGEVVVEAGAGVNSLRITHEESLLAGDFTVTANSVSSNLLPAVHYTATGGSFDEVTVVGGNAHDLIRVQSTSSGAAVTRVTGWANPLCGVGGIADDIVVSSTGENDGHLAGIRNKLIIDSHADGETVVRVSDRLAASGNGDVVWSGNQLTGFAGQNDDAVIEFGAGLADVSLVGSNAPNVRRSMVSAARRSRRS